MRPSINTVHIFQKELNSKLSKPRTPPRAPARNPILLESEPVREIMTHAPLTQVKGKPRQLALTDFSDKAKGTFAFSYPTVEAPKPSKRLILKQNPDPIKPAEVIPEARFKRPERNPITVGENSKNLETKVNRNQVSTVFSNSGKEKQEFREQKKNVYDLCRTYKNKSSVFQETIPEARTQRARNTTQAEELIQYKYAPSYRDTFISPKPQSSRYDKGETRQYEDLKNFTHTMREKRNSSSIFS